MEKQQIAELSFDISHTKYLTFPKFYFDRKALINLYQNLHRAKVTCNPIVVNRKQT